MTAERGGRLSYAATKIYLEINDLRAKIPTPVAAEAAFAAMAAYRAWVGYPELVTFLTEFRDEVKERVAKGSGHSRGALPLHLLLQPSLLRPGHPGAARAEFKAVNVMDMLQWWREDGMADRSDDR